MDGWRDRHIRLRSNWKRKEKEERKRKRKKKKKISRTGYFIARIRISKITNVTSVTGRLATRKSTKKKIRIPQASIQGMVQN